MLQDRKLKEKIIGQIELLQINELKEVQKVLNELKKHKKKKEKILSFSGAWKDIDEETFNVLIDENRRKSIRRDRIE